MAAPSPPPPPPPPVAAVVQIERAWHLLTVLLRLGRPASPAELALRCSLPPAPSPDLIEFLCGIPGSPLLLTGDGLVTASEVAIAVLGGFCPSAIPTLVPRVGISAPVQRREWEGVSLTYVRKRKARPVVEDPVIGVRRAKRRLPSGRVDIEIGENEGGRHQLGVRNAIQSVSQEVQFSIANILTKDILLFDISSMGFASCILNPDCSFSPSICNSNAILSSFGTKCSFHMGCGGENRKQFNNTLSMVVHEDLLDFQRYKDNFLGIDVNYNCCIHKAISLRGNKVSHPEIGLPLIDIVADKPALCNETAREDSNSKTYSQLPAISEMNLTKTRILGTEKELRKLSTKGGTIAGYAAEPMEKAGDAEATDCKVEESSINICAFGGDHDKRLSKEQAASKVEPSVFHLSAEPCTVVRRPRKLFMKQRIADGIRSQTSKVAFDIKREGSSAKQDQAKRDDKDLIMTHKMKRSHIQNMHCKENKGGGVSKDPKNDLEPKLLPNFESFIIEDEEGSGGYGTVYRARRKTDGKVFAVKCPHSNAHSHHAKNELKMLERFGGKHFVIKYEGSFRSGDSECFVLEHVEHDRPEVLKKEIDVFELRWYGYCMFKALSSLHRQGIVHRDVKPGNFLFSRKLNKGYLIDFNLASDLHQKLLRRSKSQIELSVSSNPVSMPTLKPTHNPQPRRCVKIGLLDNVTVEASNDLKNHVISKNMKNGSCRRPLDSLHKTINKNRCGSQAADVSGVTSAKDPTSTRTPSADRLKQPIPCKGRKELINFLHETMQSPKNKASTVPVSQRKRVAAPLGKVDRRLVIPTPMPLHSGGNAVAGAGMFKTKGNDKHKREGPCVGTKGFRAPEVLFKSLHQGSKVDIWSAGVTLLYLMIGRTPFGGDPEQNLKEISKLRGSEDLWEVAKLHNCESSYPSELFSVRFLETMELREWCEMNTRRPEFLETVPQSLFDLVDKCLTVNPRCRLTADEALKHEFFAPCHESLEKRKILRKVAASELASLSSKMSDSSC